MKVWNLFLYYSQMESDVKQSQQAQLLAKVSPAHACGHSSFTHGCLGQEEAGRCLGAVLTDADAAYVSCSSHLSSHEEGETFIFLLLHCSHEQLRLHLF